MGKDNSYKISTIAETESFLALFPEWRHEDDHLKASFRLPDFETAVVVINEIAEVAKRMDHHPRLTSTYDQLEFSLCTHSVGDKVTSYDHTLAKEISYIVAKYR